MDIRPILLLFLFFVIISNKNGDSLRTRRRVGLLDFRKMMKVFVRYNIKTNVLPYSAIIAFAMGFRANWDIKPALLSQPKRRITQQQYSSYNPNQYQYQYPYQNNQYQKWYRPTHYQRAIHSAVKGAFDWHGLNGSACLQRTFCEVSKIHQDDVISQILKIVFNQTEDVICPEELDCKISLVQMVDYVLTGAGVTATTQ